jgi:hypothetical protein
MTEFLEFLIWLSIGTSGGLVIAIIFYLIARYLNARDDGKDAKTGGPSPGE